MENLWDFNYSLAGFYLKTLQHPWEALAGIGDLILELGPKLGPEYHCPGENIWVHSTVKIAPTASITGPCILGPNTEVRPGAFIRGNALVGASCVVGNSTELKNVILFDGVQVPHYNYVGDSILGHKAHMGAGAVTSNVRADKAPVKIGGVNTGRKKVGAFLGDYAEIGCNAVLNPGTVVGRNSQVYPTACVRGIVPANHIYKANDTCVEKQ